MNVKVDRKAGSSIEHLSFLDSEENEIRIIS
jgi:hypothetical protein